MWGWTWALWALVWAGIAVAVWARHGSALVSRVLSVLLTRVCVKNQLLSVKTSYRGILVRSLHLRTTGWNTEGLFFSVVHLRISTLQLSFVWATTCLKLVVDGLDVCLQQKHMPEHLGVHHLQEHPHKAELQLLDRLLWKGLLADRQSSLARAALRRVLLQIIHFIARHIILEVRDASVQYRQEGEPGPRGSSAAQPGTPAHTHRWPGVGQHVPGSRGTVQSVGTGSSSSSSFVELLELRMRILIVEAPKHVSAAAEEVVQGTAAGQADVEQVEASSRWSLRQYIPLVRLYRMYRWYKRRTRKPVLRSPDLLQCTAAGVDIILRSNFSTQATEPEPPQGPIFSFGTAPERTKLARKAPGQPPAAAPWAPTGVGLGPTTAQPTSWTLEDLVVKQWKAMVTLRASAGPLATDMKHGQEAGSTPMAACIDIASGVARAAAGTWSDVADSSGLPKAAGLGSGRLGEEGLGQRAWVEGLEVAIEVKSIVPWLSVDAAAMLLRMGQRVVTYNRFAPFWATRPLAPVTQSPAQWWQHAGRAVLTEHRKLLQLQTLQAAVQRRREYCSLYATLHGHGAATLQRSVWRKKARARAQQQLQEMESKMTVLEVVHFRIAVAAKHSPALQGDPHLRHRVLGSVDALSSLLGSLPSLVAAAEAVPLPLVPLQLRLRCPALGVRLLLPAAEATAAGRRGDQGAAAAGVAAAGDADAAARAYHAVLVMVEGISIEVPEAGQASIKAQSIHITGLCSSATSPKQPLQPQHVLQVPMAPEHRVINGPHMELSTPPGASPSPPAPTHSIASSLASKQVHHRLRIYPQSEICDLLAKIQISLAPVQLTANCQVLAAALEFGQSCSKLLSLPRHAPASATSCPAGTSCPADPGPPPAQPGAPELKLAPSLQALVLESLGAAQVAVPHPWTSGTPILDFSCPQICLSCPFTTPAAALPSATAPYPFPHTRHALTLHISGLTAFSEYHNTAYQQLSSHLQAHFHLEASFIPLPPPPPTTPAPLPKAPYPKLWLHPSDLALLYPAASSDPAPTAPPATGSGRWAPKASGAQSRSLSIATNAQRFRRGSVALEPLVSIRSSRSSSIAAFLPAATFRTPGAAAAEVQEELCTPPFVPLLKAGPFYASSTSLMPLEPTAPGSHITQQALACGSLLAWFSPLQAHLAAAFVTSLKAQLASFTPATRPRTRSPTPTTPRTPPASPIATQSLAPGSSSQTAILVQLDSASILCFGPPTSTPAPFPHGPSAPSSRFSVRPPDWTLSTTAPRTPFVDYATTIAPLLSISAVNTQAAICFTPSTAPPAIRLTSDGLVASNLQNLPPAAPTPSGRTPLAATKNAAFSTPRRPQHANPSTPTSRCPSAPLPDSAGPTHTTPTRPQTPSSPPPPSSTPRSATARTPRAPTPPTTQPRPPGHDGIFLSPLAPRTAPLLHATHTHRRTLLNFPTARLPTGPERTAIIHHRWRRCLTTRLLQRRADLSLFLLSRPPIHQLAAQLQHAPSTSPFAPPPPNPSALKNPFYLYHFLYLRDLTRSRSPQPPTTNGHSHTNTTTATTHDSTSPPSSPSGAALHRRRLGALRSTLFSFTLGLGTKSPQSPRAQLPRVAPRRRSTGEIPAGVGLPSRTSSGLQVEQLGHSPVVLGPAQPRDGLVVQRLLNLGTSTKSTSASGHAATTIGTTCILSCARRFQTVVDRSGFDAPGRGIFAPNSLLTPALIITLGDAASAITRTTTPPKPTSSMQAAAAAAASTAPSAAGTHLGVRVTHLVAQTGAHTTSTLLQLVGYLQPVVHAASAPAHGHQRSPATPPSPQPGPAASQPGRLQVSVQLYMLRATVELEEDSPPAAPAAAAHHHYGQHPSRPVVAAPAAREVIVATLFNSTVNIGHFATSCLQLSGLQEDVMGPKIDVHAEHVTLRNPRAALEHQVVLSANSQPKSFHGLEPPSDCALLLTIFLPSTRNASPFLVASLDAPRCVMLLRFISDVLFSVRAIGADAMQALSNAAGHMPHPQDVNHQLPASAVVEGGSAPSPANQAPPADDTMQHPDPTPHMPFVVAAVVNDLQLVLPASAKQVDGQGLRPAASNAALVAYVQKAQVVLPGTGTALLGAYGPEVQAILDGYQLEASVGSDEDWPEDMARSSIDIAERSLKEDDAEMGGGSGGPGSSSASSSADDAGTAAATGAGGGGHASWHAAAGGRMGPGGATAAQTDGEIEPADLGLDTPTSTGSLPSASGGRQHQHQPEVPVPHLLQTGTFRIPLDPAVPGGLFTAGQQQQQHHAGGAHRANRSQQQHMAQQDVEAGSGRATAGTGLEPSEPSSTSRAAPSEPGSPLLSPASYPASAGGEGISVPDRCRHIFFAVSQIEVAAADILPVSADKVRRWRIPTGLGQLSNVLQMLYRADLDGLMFSNPSTGANHLHFKFLGSSDVELVLCCTRFKHLIDTCTQNLVETRSKLAPPLPPRPQHARRTEYSPDLSFGPWLGQNPGLCLTFIWETIKCRLEGHPGWWDGERREESVQQVVPFVGAEMWNCSLAVQMMAPSWEVQLGLCSGDLQLFDLRLADGQLRSRCHQRNAADGMVSPFSPTPMQAYSPPDLAGDFHWGSPRLHSPPRSPDGQLPSGIQTPGGTSGADGLEYGEGPRPVVEEMDIDCEQVPVIRLIQTRVPLPEGESMHLSAREPTGGIDGPDPDESFFKVRYALLQEGTSMVQVQLRQSLVQWPYLTDMSLISAIVSVFVPTWAVPPADISPPPPILQPYAWLYVNVLLTDSQLYIPLLSPHMPSGTQPWDEPDLRSGALFPRLAQLLVRRHSPPPARPPGGLFRHQSSIIVTDPRDLLRPKMDLQHLGLAVTMSHLRFGYFYGGDGESRMKVDLGQMAAHLRDPQAMVTCFLLPVNAVSFEWAARQPFAEENASRMQRLRNITRSVILIQRAWRGYMLRQGGAHGKVHMGKAGIKEDVVGQLPHAGPSRTLLMGRSTAGFSEVAAMALPEQQAQSVEERLLLRAWQHATELDEELSGKRQFMIRTRASKEDAPATAAGALPTALDMSWLLGGNHAAQPPAAHSSHITLVVTACTVRASFSNVPFWRSINGEVQLVSEHMAAGGGLFGQAPPPLIARAQTIVAARPAPIPALPALPPSTSFRQRAFKAELQVGSISAVLCDDKPNSFGAPDVLQAEAAQLEAVYMVEARLPGHDPQITGRVALRAAASFLNSSTSRWEAMLHPWPLAITLSDPINPMFKSSRTKYVWAVSDEPLQVRFHPSCLLTLGDALAFARHLTEPWKPSWSPAAAPDMLAGTSNALLMEEQMALAAPVTARAPQRYLIHNQTGLDLWYSVEQGRPGRGFRLPNYCREELRVAPVRQWVRTVTPGGTTVNRRQASVIHLQPEGSWNPILCVTVDEVGKFRYPLQTPLTDVQVPIIVDVSLAGRTKIVRLHSSLWLHNSTALTLKLQLHLPPTQFNGLVVLAPGDTWGASAQDLRLQPLRPDEGRYLPVAAALGGVLRVVPEGYQDGGSDVIRLSPDLKRLKEQEGYIACTPVATGRATARHSFEGGISVVTSLPAMAPSQRVHLAVQVKAKVRDSWHFAGSNLLDSPAPSEFLRLDEALESTIRIQPTLILTNALPYFVRLTVASSPVARQEDTKVAKLPPGATQDLYLDRSINLFMAAAVPQLGLSSSKAVLINRMTASVAWNQADLATSITMTRRKDDDAPDAHDMPVGGHASEASMLRLNRSQGSVARTPIPPSTPQHSFHSVAAAGAFGTPGPPTKDRTPTAASGTPQQPPFPSPFATTESTHRRSRSGSSIADLLRRNLPRSNPNSAPTSPLHPANKPPFISLLPPTPIRLPTIASPATPLHPTNPPTMAPLFKPTPPSTTSHQPSPSASPASPQPTAPPSVTPSPSPPPPTSDSAAPSNSATPSASAAPPDFITQGSGSQPSTPDLDLPFMFPPGWTTNPAYSMSLQSSPLSSRTMAHTTPSGNQRNPMFSQSTAASTSPNDDPPAPESPSGRSSGDPTTPPPTAQPESLATDHPTPKAAAEATAEPSTTPPALLLTHTSSSEISPLPWPTPPPHSPLSASQQPSPSISPLRPLSPSLSPGPGPHPLADVPDLTPPRNSNSNESQDIVMVPYPSRHPSQTNSDYLIPSPIDPSELIPFPGIVYSPEHSTPSTPTRAATPITNPTITLGMESAPDAPQSPTPPAPSSQPKPPSPTQAPAAGPVAEADEATSPYTPPQSQTPTLPQTPRTADAVAASLVGLLTPSTNDPMLAYSPVGAGLASVPLPAVRPSSPLETVSRNSSRHRRTVSLPSGMDALGTPEAPAAPSASGAGQEHSTSAPAAPLSVASAGAVVTQSCLPGRGACLPGRSSTARKQVACSSPDVLLLGIANSLNSQTHDKATCKIVLFCPVWVHNRTGLPLVLTDDPPLLKPGPMISLLRTSPVLSAHIKMDAFDRGGMRRGRPRTAQDAPLRARPTLLNNTRTLQLSLQPEGSSTSPSWTRAFNINTIGIKSNIEIKGPAAAAAAVPAAGCAGRQQQRQQQQQHLLRNHEHQQEQQPRQQPSTAMASPQPSVLLPAQKGPAPPGRLSQVGRARRLSADSIPLPSSMMQQTAEPQLSAPSQGHLLQQEVPEAGQAANGAAQQDALAAALAVGAGPLGAGPLAEAKEPMGLQREIADLPLMQHTRAGAPASKATGQGLAGTARSAAVAEAVEDEPAGQAEGAFGGPGICGARLGAILSGQPAAARVQRLHQFAVEVRPAPADGVFRRSKVSWHRVCTHDCQKKRAP